MQEKIVNNRLKAMEEEHLKQQAALALNEPSGAVQPAIEEQPA